MDCQEYRPFLPLFGQTSRACSNSNWKPCDRPASTLTENSTPTLRSSPERSFGRILVPRRFQTSGGTVPLSRSVAFCGGLGGIGGLGGTGGLEGTGGSTGGPSGVARSCSALVLANRKTPDSKATSSAPTGSLNHNLSYSPPPLSPEASPKSPAPTNSTMRRRRTVSGSINRVSAPFKPESTEGMTLQQRNG